MNKPTDQSLWKLVNYFVSNHGYTLVQIQGIKDEIWLTNPKHTKFPIIRLSPTTVNATFFEKDRIKLIYNAIAKLHQIDQKLLDIHTKIADDEEFDEEFVQVSVNEKTMIPEILSKAYTDIKLAFSMQSSPQQIKEKINKASIKSKKKPFYEVIPPVTLTFLALLVAVFTAITFLSRTFEDPIAVSILLGSYYKVFITANNEYWRFLTAGFVHIDFFHLLVNSIALLNLGMITERVFGSVKFSIILFVSIIMGSWFVYVGQGNMVLVGASGGLYGLMGALLVYTFESGAIRQPAIRSQFIRILLINAMISFLPGISLLGHLGGFVAGIMLAIFFSVTPKWKAIRLHSKIAFGILLFSMGTLTGMDDNVRPFYLITDQRVINYARELNLDWYANRIEVSLVEFYEEQ